MAGEHLQVLSGARLIDGTGGPVVEDAVVLLDGARIAGVGPRGAVVDRKSVV